MKTPIRFLFTLLCAAIVSLPSVHAATITVNSTADPIESGKTTLRNALAAAANGDTINFSVTTPATITLDSGSGQLVVSSSVIISGPGADQLTVDANHSSRVFMINSGLTVTISGLTITNGSTSGNSFGGGIANSDGTLTVNNSTISSNSASGISNLTGTVAVNNSTVTGNSGSGIGNGGTLTVNNSIISGNSGLVGGGGIANAGTATVNNSTISGNSVSGAHYPVPPAAGGGIYNFGGCVHTFEGCIGGVRNAILTVNNSTISGNFAGDGLLDSFDAAGGGIYNLSGTVTVSNSTISGNSISEFAVHNQGGGIANFAGLINGQFAGTASLTVNNSTITDNTARLALSIYNSAVVGGTAAVTISSTILNAGRIANIVSETAAGTVTSLGYNLSNDGGSGFLTATGDQINTDPMLGPLQDNGGPTFTHALLTGSSAIDKGKNFTAGTTDQRGAGFARTVDNPLVANATGGDGTDIGAFEVQTPPYAAQIQQPINADGTSVFNVRRGIVPVKFTLTLNGVSTCDLPPATIALYRTGTGGNQSIDESVYTGPADNGSNFRIDSCQYIYNLSASALGTGTYEVDILINGQVVGTAALTLK